MMYRYTRTACLIGLFCFSAVGCMQEDDGAPVTPDDRPDAAQPDRGGPDLGHDDTPDEGDTPDVGRAPDEGSLLDAGVDLDAGAPDAGDPPDMDRPDIGDPPDAGDPPDVGDPPDMDTPDVGGMPDMGTPDAGAGGGPSNPHVLRNHDPGCNGQGYGIYSGEQGYYYFERLAPPTYPFTVTKIRHKSYHETSYGCDATIPHHVMLFASSSPTLEASPLNPIVLPSQAPPQASWSDYWPWIEVTLPTPIELQAGEMLYVGVAMVEDGTPDVNNCVVRCDSAQTPQESSFLSGNDAPPFSPVTMASTGSWGNTVLEAHGSCEAATCTASCFPEEDRVFCSRQGATCGTLTGLDNCGGTRTATCGSCASSLSCQQNVCADSQFRYESPTLKPAEVGYSEILTSPNGHLLVPYITRNSAIPMLATRTAQGWDTEPIDSFGGVQSIDVALDPQGAPHTAYLRYMSTAWRPTSTPIDQTLHYATKQAGVWTHQQVPAPGIDEFSDVVIDVDQTGTPHILYSANRTTLKHAWRDSTGWQEEVVTTSMYRPFSHSLIVAPGGEMHVTYQGGDSFGVTYAHKPVGGSWIKKPIDSPVLNSSPQGPHLALDPSGQALIAFTLRPDPGHPGNPHEGLYLATVTSTSPLITIATEVVDDTDGYEDNGVTSHNRVGLFVAPNGRVRIAAKFDGHPGNREVRLWTKENGTWSLMSLPNLAQHDVDVTEVGGKSAILLPWARVNPVVAIEQ